MAQAAVGFRRMFGRATTVVPSGPPLTRTDYPPIEKESCQVPENAVRAVSCVAVIVTRR